jgi:NCS2 family nucleobase:cation symporter-2
VAGGQIEFGGRHAWRSCVLGRGSVGERPLLGGSRRWEWWPRVGGRQSVGIGRDVSPAMIVSMCIVALVIMTETTGDMLAVGEIVDKHVSPRRLADGLRADGLSTVLGGVFNTFPYTAFAQNVGLVSLTGVKSRYVATFAGGVLIILGLLPKLGAVVEGIPVAVLGGAGIALFGMVAASGVRTLGKVHLTNSNILVIAVAVGVGLLPTVNGEIYAQFPVGFQIIFDSGISAGAMTAIVLNLLLNSDAANQRVKGDGEHASYDAVRGAAADTEVRQG